MKNVIRYLLEGDGSVPKFVDSGGFWPLDEELVGISVDSSKRHLPSTVHTVTKQELIDRVMLVTSKDLEESTEIVETFLSQHGMQDYV